MTNLIELSQQALARLYEQKPELRNDRFLQWFEQVLAFLSMYFAIKRVTDVVEPTLEIRTSTAEPMKSGADALLKQRDEFWANVESAETAAKAKAAVDKAVEQYDALRISTQVIPTVSAELPVDPTRQTGASQLLGGGFSVGIDPKIRK